MLTSTAWADSGASDLDVVKGNVQGTINGSFDANEYIAGGPFNILDGFGNTVGTFEIQTYRNGDGSIEEIQFLFDITDISVNADEDEIRIRFDSDHSHTTVNDSPDETDRTVRVIRQISGGGTDQVLISRMDTSLPGTTIEALDAGNWTISSNAMAWEAEVKLDSSDLGLGYIPNIFGMHIQVIRSASPTTIDDSTGTYPPSIATTTIGSWANIRTRNPINYALVLDRSGSMDDSIDGTTNDFERWNSAIIASEIFTQLFHAFSTSFDDRIGVLTFTASSAGASGCAEDTPDVALTSDPDFDLLRNIIVNDYVSNQIGDLLPENCTPIKDALNTAFDESNDHAGADNIILLLSDGFHNVPSTDYNERAYDFNGSNQADFEVNTVALESETDTDADTGLLHDISQEFQGQSAIYHDATSKAEMVDAFADILTDRLYVNRTSVDGSGQFTVNGDEPNLLVMLVWHGTIAGERNFRLKPPSTVALTPALGDATYTAAQYQHHRNTTAGRAYEVAYYRVNNPEPGTWTIWQEGADVALIADNNLALFDPTIYARFHAKGVGDDILLTASLKEEGKPIVAPDAAVTVTVSRPDEGLGTFVSTTQLNCRLIEPTLPPVDKVVSAIVPGNPDLKTGPYLNMHKLVSFKQPVASTSDTQQVIADQLPLHMVKLNTLFDSCGKTGFNRSNNVLQLYDDGTHGDAVANDGIHSLRYANANKEGTYIFDFDANGKAPSGSEFSRIRKFSYHKSVNVFTLTTLVGERVLFNNDNIITKEYYVIPQDKAGEYLGPGHVSDIAFHIAGAEPIGKVNDYANGIYTQIVQYDPKQGEPKVIPVVQGQPVVGKGGDCQYPLWLWIMILGGIFLIFLLLLCCLTRRR